MTGMLKSEKKRKHIDYSMVRIFLCKFKAIKEQQQLRVRACARHHQSHFSVQLSVLRKELFENLHFKELQMVSLTYFEIAIVVM